MHEYTPQFCQVLTVVRRCPDTYWKWKKGKLWALCEYRQLSSLLQDQKEFLHSKQLFNSPALCSRLTYFSPCPGSLVSTYENHTMTHTHTHTHTETHTHTNIFSLPYDSVTGLFKASHKQGVKCVLYSLLAQHCMCAHSLVVQLFSLYSVT